MKDKPVKICPICHKAFTIKDGRQKIRYTCSLACATLFNRHDRYARQRLVEQAAQLKRPPRTSCKMHTDAGSCSGLNALWCKYEECKFYKPKEVDNG